MIDASLLGEGYPLLAEAEDWDGSTQVVYTTIEASNQAYFRSRGRSRKTKPCS